jgi:hypothetical protein
MHRRRALHLLLAASLIALADSGCPGSCNCPNNTTILYFPAELDVQLTASGDACTSAPFCEAHGDGGACTEYGLVFTNVGACQLTASAADGRQVTASVSTRVLYKDTCCGTAYAPDPYESLLLTFDRDAATGVGG